MITRTDTHINFGNGRVSVSVVRRGGVRVRIRGHGLGVAHFVSWTRPSWVRQSARWRTRSWRANADVHLRSQSFSVSLIASHGMTFLSGSWFWCVLFCVTLYLLNRCTRLGYSAQSPPFFLSPLLSCIQHRLNITPRHITSQLIHDIYHICVILHFSPSDFLLFF